MNSSIMCLGRAPIPLLEVRTYPKVLNDENWVFSSLSKLIQMARSHGRNPAEFLLYRRTSTTGNFIS
jgi:hypothetical protein